MEDNSSASSDSDNALLSAKDHKSHGQSAATQTPELPRRDKNPSSEIPEEAKIQENPSSITVYKLDTQKPMSELENEAKSLAIPDVVVEYIKESYRRQDEDGHEQGNTNLAFEPQELIVVRTPSCVSLREEASAENGMTLTTLGNNILYHSMPRTLSGKTEDQSRLLSVVDPSLSASVSSLGYPRSIPPSPNFGYRPLESETSAVYTIIAPVRYVSNGSDKEMEAKLLAQLQEQMEKEKATARKFEFCTAPIEVERRRHRLQCVTDTCSTMFLVPGIFIAIITPISLIPMFILPLKYMLPLMAIFVICGIIAVLSLAVSGFFGNIVWHYDDKKQRIRPRLHCGTGPLMHFWGNGFYPLKEDNELLKGSEKIV